MLRRIRQVLVLALVAALLAMGLTDDFGGPTNASPFLGLGLFAAIFAMAIAGWMGRSKRQGADPPE